MMVVSRLDQILKVKRAGSVLNDHVSEFDFADANASDKQLTFGVLQILVKLRVFKVHLRSNVEEVDV